MVQWCIDAKQREGNWTAPTWDQKGGRGGPYRVVAGITLQSVAVLTRERVAGQASLAT
jgi:hypothetical protein